MKRIFLASLSVVFAACAGGTPTSPASKATQPLSGVVSGLSATSAAATATYDFFACSGPAGTPTSFTAEKTALPSAAGQPVSASGAFQLTDGSAVFVVLSFGQGNFSPPGIGVSGNATTSCSVTIGSSTQTWSGIFVATP